MNGKLSLASLASIAGLTLALLMSAQGPSGYAFGKDHGRRDYRRGEYRNYEGRDEGDQGEDWNGDDRRDSGYYDQAEDRNDEDYRDSGYYGQGEDRNDEDYRDSGYYGDGYPQPYGRRHGRVTVVVGDPGYGGYVQYGNEDYGYGRPQGYDRGRKRGWRGCDLPPGQAKKYGCQSNYLDYYGGR